MVKLASLGSVLCLDNFLSLSHYYNTGIDLRRIKAVSKFKSFVTFLNIAIIIFFLLLCTISVVSCLQLIQRFNPLFCSASNLQCF